jgi:hypothetical protein
MKDFTEQDKYLQAKKRVEKIKGFYAHLFWYLVVNAFIAFMILKNSDPADLTFWTFSTAIFWGIGLAFHAYAVFGKQFLFTKDWEERKIKEFMDEDKREYWK